MIKIKFKNRTKIIRKIVLEFDNLLSKNLLKEEAARKTKDDIENQIIRITNPVQFDENLKVFFKNHPEFKKTEQEIINMTNEFLQKIGQECIEAIIDEDPSAWETLSKKIVDLDEANIEDFSSEIPQIVYPNFIEKLQTA